MTFNSNLPRLPAETRDGNQAGASLIQLAGQFNIANTGNPKITTQISKANNAIAAVIHFISQPICNQVHA